MSDTSHPPRTVLVAGAAGRTGRLVVVAARAAGLVVRGLTRDPARVQPLRDLGVAQGCRWNEQGWGMLRLDE